MVRLCESNEKAPCVCLKWINKMIVRWLIAESYRINRSLSLSSSWYDKNCVYTMLLSTNHIHPSWSVNKRHNNNNNNTKNGLLIFLSFKLDSSLLSTTSASVIIEHSCLFNELYALNMGFDSDQWKRPLNWCCFFIRHWPITLHINN